MSPTRRPWSRQVLRQLADGGRLARAEEAADHDVARLAGPAAGACGFERLHGRIR